MYREVRHQQARIRSVSGRSGWNCKHCSVGYEHLRELSSEIRDGIEYVKFSWRPYEASFVAIPADPTVGVGRSTNHHAPNRYQGRI